MSRHTLAPPFMRRLKPTSRTKHPVKAGPPPSPPSTLASKVKAWTEKKGAAPVLEIASVVAPVEAVTTAVPEAPAPENLSELTNKQLRALAGERGIDLPTRVNKAELV